MASWLLRRFQIVSRPSWRQCFCSSGYIKKREASFKRNIAIEKNICYTYIQKVKYPAESGSQGFSKGADGERTLSAPFNFYQEVIYGSL